MARRAWIFILGFAFCLFIGIDLTVAFLIITHRMTPSSLGSMFALCAYTWGSYIALRRRIKSTPGSKLKFWSF